MLLANKGNAARKLLTLIPWSVDGQGLRSFVICAGRRPVILLKLRDRRDQRRDDNGEGATYQVVLWSHAVRAGLSSGDAGDDVRLRGRAFVVFKGACARVVRALCEGSTPHALAS